MRYYPGAPGLFWLKRPVGASVLGIAGKSGSSNIDHATSPPCANAPTYQRNIASVARLQRANGRDRPGSIRAVVVHGVITGTYKSATAVVEAGIHIAGYGITGRNYFGTGFKYA